MEFSRLLLYFEHSSDEDIVQVSPLHHEELGKVFQTKFETKVIALKKAFTELANPLNNSVNEIFFLHNRNTIDEESVKEPGGN